MLKLPSSGRSRFQLLTTFLELSCRIDRAGRETGRDVGELRLHSSEPVNGEIGAELMAIRRKPRDQDEPNYSFQETNPISQM